MIHDVAFTNLDAATLYALLQLRTDVFVVEQECAYPELDGRDTEPGTRHMWIELDGTVAAYLRVLLDAPGERRIGRVVTHAEHRGAGLAGQLVDAALRHEASVFVLDAQSHLVDWYKAKGFDAVGDEYIEDGIAHVAMQRKM